MTPPQPHRGLPARRSRPGSEPVIWRGSGALAARIDRSRTVDGRPPPPPQGCPVRWMSGGLPHESFGSRSPARNRPLPRHRRIHTCGLRPRGRALDDIATRFRKVVRSAIRHHGGHEANFTGDGFLATFPEPAKAVAAGVAITHAVQELGIDVRVGLHTGEVQTIQGHLGGVAVHIGARVMALAGSAEVLVTSTVKDLVHGSSIEFDDVAAHELKGVPGTWQLVAVRSLAANPRPCRSIRPTP